jgi:hypothetical protein
MNNHPLLFARRYMFVLILLVKYHLSINAGETPELTNGGFLPSMRDGQRPCTEHLKIKKYYVIKPKGRKTSKKIHDSDTKHTSFLLHARSIS